VNGEIHYTRDGRFAPDRNGDLVTGDGHQLYPGFNIPLSTTNVNIDNLGKVEIFQPGSLEAVELGSIPVFTFVNPAGLRSLGGDLYAATRASGEAIENVAGENNAGVIMQGALEYSNVNIMTEMTDLIRAQRAYEMNSKVMQVADQMMQTINGVVR
jgi:flagellar basal-body rod protein FlgG